jgi:hypothetical protein
MKKIFGATKFFSIPINEVITIDNNGWVGIYVVPILFTFKR